MKQARLIELISAVLIILFGYTAVSKLLDFEVFGLVLEATPVVGPHAKWIAWTLPAVELVIALLLILPKFRLTGLIAAFILMLLLTGYLLWMVTFHKELPCNCGGVLKALGWKQHIVFNLLFTVLAGTGVVLARKQQQLVSRFLHN